MKQHEILMVDDDPAILDVFGCALEYKGYQITSAVSGEAALELFASRAFDVVITDISMPGLDGLEVLKKIKAQSPETRVIIMTANHHAKVVVSALRLGADDYIFKPCDINEVWERVAHQLEQVEAQRGRVSVAPHAAMNEQTFEMIRIMAQDMKDSFACMAAALKKLQQDTREQVDSANHRRMSELHAKATRMVGMAEDFLARATSVNGELEMECEEVDLREDVVDPVLDELCPELQARRIAIDNQLDAVPSNQIPVIANKVWLKTVFRNLLRNAIQFGGKGCTVSIGIEETGTHCQLNVFNSGQPVPEPLRDRLFSKFGRISISDQSTGLGVGLGLYLSKEILKKHGGEIWYEAKSQGSNFVFTLPHN
jgi:signal transduction histidine kinase